MSVQSRLRSALGGVLGRRKMERDMDDELRFHIAAYTDDLVRSGVTPAEAARRARIEFGGVEPLKEDCRQARGLRFLDETSQDLRFAARMLRKSPGFAAVAIVTLALGIGANTAIFSLVDAWVLRPVPYHDGDQLLSIFSSTRQGQSATAPADFLDWQRDDRQNDRQLFDSLCAFSARSATLLHGDDPERIIVNPVSAGFFRMLGVSPEQGRDFLDSEDQPGAPPVALLSNGLWRGRFGGDASILGRSITVDGAHVTVVGVMPANFHFPLMGRAALWMPLALSASDRQNRVNRFLDVIGRLKPGVSRSRARGFFEAEVSRLAAQYSATNANRGVLVHSLREEIGRQGAGEQTLGMFGLVGCVLLIACANVANLVVGRAVARQREMAVRLAIGAGRWRLMRQILTENLVLFLMAGAASVLFAVWGVRWIDHAIEASIPQASRAFLPNFGSVAVEWPALLYTLAIAIVAGLVFGFAPAFQVRRTDVNHGLKESARSSSGSRGIRLKNALIVAELSLALVVLVASGLLVKGLVRMYASDTGFQPNGLVTTYITLSDAKYADLQRAESFFRESLEKLRSLAGVTAASMGWSVPYSGNESMTRYAVEGRALPPPTEAPSTMFQAVSPDYFATMGIPLLTGRMLSEQDKSDSLPVVLINQTMAKLHWPGGDPVGQRLRYGQLLGRSVTIAGVVRDTNGMNEHDLPAPMLFFPYPQLPSRGMTVILRSALPLSTLAAAVRGVVKSVDANQPIAELETIDQLIDIQRAPSRIIVQATSFFAALSLFLAAMGTYAVMAYAVAARRQEFGIRMALGAARRDLLSLVLGQGLKLAAGGLLVGLAASYGVMRLLGFMFYHVSPSDPPTFLGITILLLAVAALACYLPARRASTIDPTTALRYE